MRGDDRAFVVGEKRHVPFVSEHREERLLVGELASERIRHAHSLRSVGAQQRGAIVFAGEDVVDEDAPVHQIDPRVATTERAIVVGELTRIAHHRRHTSRGERRLENLELAPRRNLAPVDNGHRRRLGSTAPLAIAGDERVQHWLDRGVEPHSMRSSERTHRRRLVEQFAEPLCVAQPRRRLGVVFRKMERFGEQECVEARRGACPRIAGIQRNELCFVLCHTELVEDRWCLECRSHDTLAQRRNRFSGDSHP